MYINLSLDMIDKNRNRIENHMMIYVSMIYTIQNEYL